MRQLSRVHIPGASAAGPLTPFVPCTLSLFRPICHPGICQVGPACDRPLYARYVDGHVTAHVPGRVNRLLARAGVGARATCQNSDNLEIASSRVRVWGFSRANSLPLKQCLLARAGVGTLLENSPKVHHRLLARAGVGGFWGANCLPPKSPPRACGCGGWI